LKIINIQPTSVHTLIVRTISSPGYIGIPDKSAMCAPPYIYQQLSPDIMDNTHVGGQFVAFCNNRHFWVFERKIRIKELAGSKYLKNIIVKKPN
jgi:hypothetical protein